MRISVVSETCWTEISDITVTLRQLIPGLIDKGHQIQLICPDYNIREAPTFSNNLSLYPIKYFSFISYKNSRYGLPSRKALLRIWENQKPDIIYVTTQGPLGWTAVTQAKRLKIPTVSYFNADYLSFRQECRINALKTLARKYLIKVLNKSNTTIVSTEGQKKKLLEMGINSIAVLGQGVDANLFTPEKRSVKLRQKWGVKQLDPVLLYVGRIDTESNFDQAIRTYFILHSMNKQLKFVLVLVGDGPLAKRLKINYPEFIFTSILSQEELSNIYASADLLVFPSTSDTFSNVILEAMASGLGIISYNCATSHIHIKSEERGLLANKNDSQQFFSNAKRFLRNDLLLKKCRINAFNYAKTQDWFSIVKHIENIFNSNINTTEIEHETIDQLPIHKIKFYKV